jgi:uncharacterized protein YjbI with pentapeptide repeats
MKRLIPILAAALWFGISAPSPAQQAQQDDGFLETAGLYAPSVWDLELGAHANEMSIREFIDFACGTDGGPPSLPLKSWAEFAKCPAEDSTGFHEVYFQYDDEPEYWARALRVPTKILLYQYTSAYAIPVNVSALFDDDGFMVGFRMVTDSRVEVEMRQKGSDLAGFLMGRYADAAWVCEDLPRLEGEREFQGNFFKARCVQHNEAAGLDLVVERHHLRKAGQFAINPADGLPMTGKFDSSSSLEVFLTGGIPDRAARLSALADSGPTERDLAIKRAMDCPGCDLANADFKRADLRGANLAGADLTRANFHGAILAGADLSGAILVRANLNRADMKRANLAGANLSDAMMFAARLDRADLSGARLQGAYGGKIQMIGATVTNANLSRMDLREARLNDANFSGSNINQANMDDAQLTRSTLAGVNMILTSMHRVSLVDADLTGADARASDLFGANLRGADLTNADFSRGRLENVNFFEAKITGTVFDGALLPAGFEPE